MKDPKIPLTIALHRGFYLAIIIDRHEGTQTPLNMALLISLYLAIKIDPA
jgi:hypothetical protein